MEITPVNRSTVVFQNPSLEWSSPWEFGKQQDCFHCIETIELISAPDLAGLEAADESVAAHRLIDQVRLILQSLCSDPRPVMVEVRYQKLAREDLRLRLFLSVRAEADSEKLAKSLAETVLQVIQNGMPRSYKWESVLQIQADDELNQLSLCEVRKLELVAPAATYVGDAEFYYSAFPFEGDGSGWSQLTNQLVDFPSPAIVSVCFGPARQVPAEINAVNVAIAGLRSNANGREVSDFYGNRRNTDPDGAAAQALIPWEITHEALQSPLLVRITVAAPSDSLGVLAKVVGAAVSTRSAELSGVPNAQKSWAPVVIYPSNESEWRAARYLLENLAVGPWGGHGIWAHPDAPSTFRRIPHMFSIDQAAGAFVLPVPDREGCRGFSLTRRHSSIRTHVQANQPSVEIGISLGDVINEGQRDLEFNLGLRAINRHVLIAGAPGSGKTTTSLTILADLWRKHRIPFLAVEPVKTEYRALASYEGLEDMWIFTAGRESISPLRNNPLEPNPGISIVEHRGSVMSSFKSALPLFPPLPDLLERAIERAYRNHGWSDDDVYDPVIRRLDEVQRKLPTLQEVLTSFETIAAELEYRGEARNLIEALRVRLSSLLSGTKGRTLNTISSLDWVEVFKRPTVIELDAISDPEEKALLCSFIVSRVNAFARARGATRGQLAHVTLLEEAHQLLSGSDTEGPRSLAIEMLTSSIAELRSVGEGFIISDQQPSRLARSAVANCGTRVMHRLISNVDRSMLLDDIDADELQREVAARLRTGEVLVTYPDNDDPVLIAVVPGDGVETSEPVTDSEVLERMSSLRKSTLSLLPMNMCSKNVCSDGCSAEIRTKSSDRARLMHEGNSGCFGRPNASVLRNTLESLQKEVKDPQEVFCVIAHGMTMYGPLNLQKSLHVYKNGLERAVKLELG